jgi:recombination protein RecA
MELTDAIISGRAGVAVLFDGQSFFSFSVERPHELRPRRPAEVRLLFGEADDLEVFESVSRDDAVRALENAFSRAAALDLALITFDSSLSHELRDEAAGELDLLLSDERVCEHLENLLYAHELPEGSDLSGALARCEAERPRLLATLAGLREHQTAIANARRAWEAIPAEYFDGPAQRAELRRAAARAGMFRRLARAGAVEADDFAAELALSLPGVAPARQAEIARAWLESLAELQKIVGRQEVAGLEVWAAPLEADAHAAPVEEAAPAEAEAPATDYDRIVAEATQAARVLIHEAAPRESEDVSQTTFMVVGENTARLVKAVSTSLLSLDHATGLGGLPVGHAVEFYGPPGTGKTALAYGIATAVSQEGLSVAFIEVGQPSPFSSEMGRDAGRIWRHLTHFVESQWEAREKARELLARNTANFIVLVNMSPTYQSNALAAGQDFASLASLAASRDACLIYVTHTEPEYAPIHLDPFDFIPPAVEPTTLPGYHASLRLKFNHHSGGRLWWGRPVEVELTKNTVGQLMGKCVLTYVFGQGFSPEADLLACARECGVVSDQLGVLVYDGIPLGFDVESGVRSLRIDHQLTKRLKSEVLSVMNARSGALLRRWPSKRPDAPRLRRSPFLDDNLPLGLTFGNVPKQSPLDFKLPDGDRQKH